MKWKMKSTVSPLLMVLASNNGLTIEETIEARTYGAIEHTDESDTGFMASVPNLVKHKSWFGTSELCPSINETVPGSPNGTVILVTLPTFLHQRRGSASISTMNMTNSNKNSTSL